ncbi:predicted protein [Listeria monocytogenes J2818]|nr:predicted protein [Listeria monocytogenes J2818]
MWNITGSFFLFLKNRTSKSISVTRKAHIWPISFLLLVKIFISNWGNLMTGEMLSGTCL